MTISDALTNATRLLSQSRTDSPRLDAEVLLSYILKLSKEYLYSHGKEKILPAKEKRFNKLVSRRLKGEPVAYLTGHKEFFGLDFLVTPDVLIPRPATEGLIELIVEHLQQTTDNRQQTIIDMGTGSGCIAVTLAKKLSQAKIIATDISPRALHVAQKNAKKHRVENRIIFIRANLLSLSKGGFVSFPHEHMFEAGRIRSHLFLGRERIRPISPTLRRGEPSLREGNETNPTVLIANLPYLTPAQYRANPDLAWEPKTALVGGRDGLFYFRKLARELKKLPHQPITIFLEIDSSQKIVLKKLFSPLYRATFKKDLQDLTRYLTLTRY